MVEGHQTTTREFSLKALPLDLTRAALKAKKLGGKLPRGHAALTAFLLSKFAVPENLPPEVRSTISLEQWELVRANFAAGLAMACDCFERQRNAQWAN
jgi:hypothetical protein